MSSIPYTSQRKETSLLQPTSPPSKFSAVWDALKHPPHSYQRIYRSDQFACECQKLKPTQLVKFLEWHFQDLVAKGHDPLEAAESIASRIDFKHLEQAVYQESPSKALAQAQERLNEALYYLENVDKVFSKSLKRRLSDVLDGLIALLDSLVSVLGVAELFESSSNKWENEAKMHKMMMLVTLLGMFSSLIIPLAGASVGTPVIGGVFLFFALLSLIYPKIKPMPRKLPHAENMTQKLHDGKITDLMPVTEKREEVVKQVAKMLKANLKPGSTVKYPLLIGKSGVGKSQTIEALVQGIEEGKYPELKGKRLFSINTPELNKKGDFLSGDPLEEIQKGIGRHGANTILVFDEVHVACQKENELGERLKKRLEPNAGLPLIIGITTVAEHRDTISRNTALMRRFQTIVIDDTDKGETLTVLANSFLKSGKTAVRSDDAFQEIYRQTNERDWRQPLASREVLRNCIEQISVIQQSPTEGEIAGLHSQINALVTQEATASIHQKSQVGTQVNKLKLQITDLETQLEKDKRELTKLFEAQTQLSKVKKRNYEAVLKATRCSGSKQQRALNLTMLIAHFVSPALESYIKDVGKKKQVSVMIDKQMVTKVVQEQVAQKSRSAEAIESES